jgi:hypothetical protein
MSPWSMALALAAVLTLPAVRAGAEPVLFPPETAACYVGAEIAGGRPARQSGVPVTAVRLQRGYSQLAVEQDRAPRADGAREVNLRLIVTFADAGKKGGQKRYANGLWEVLHCSADQCDAGNFRVERQAGNAVLLRMTGGITVSGDPERPNQNRRLPDTAVYRLFASLMEACR